MSTGREHTDPSAVPSAAMDGGRAFASSSSGCVATWHRPYVTTDEVAAVSSSSSAASTREHRVDDLAERSRPSRTRRARSPVAPPRRIANAGMPIVRVTRRPSRSDGWDAPHTLIDIVNDDMPFLVDSVTMAIDRHDLGIHLVVPSGARRATRPDTDDRLRWRHSRTASGTGARRVVGAHGGRPRDVARGRSPPCAPTSSASSPTSAPRPATGCKMLATTFRRRRRRARALARPVDPEELAEGRALLRWMADQHFTFLGYRMYDLEPRRRRRRAAVVAGAGSASCATHGRSRRAGTPFPGFRRRSARRHASARCSCSPRPTRGRPCTARPTSTTSA